LDIKWSKVLPVLRRIVRLTKLVLQQ